MAQRGPSVPGWARRSRTLCWGREMPGDEARLGSPAVRDRSVAGQGPDCRVNPVGRAGMVSGQIPAGQSAGGRGLRILRPCISWEGALDARCGLVCELECSPAAALPVACSEHIQGQGKTPYAPLTHVARAWQLWVQILAQPLLPVGPWASCTIC